MPRRSAAVAFSLFALASAARADVHPNTQSGFPVDQVFQVGEIDNVNLFNGALTLTIPVGQSYPVGGGFSYGLKLIYNSSPWRFETVTLGSDPFTEYTQGIPTECSNAGFGWRV
ncbi:MAG TPA: hypothetical protein VJ725_25105, partial [Thermoanaerobaculia bacterium]|nr:hypothetical protein [Thermoanaerobaculia bacterium]